MFNPTHQKIKKAKHGSAKRSTKKKQLAPEKLPQKNQNKTLGSEWQRSKRLLTKSSLQLFPIFYSPLALCIVN